MYVCMHVYMYACMHACMYVCMYVFVYPAFQSLPISTQPNIHLTLFRNSFIMSPAPHNQAFHYLGILYEVQSFCLIRNYRLNIINLPSLINLPS